MSATMMTSHEVVNNLLRKQKADRVAVMDLPWHETIAAWVRQGYPTRLVAKEPGDKCWRPDDGRWDRVTLAGEYVEPIPAWEHFGYDMVEIGPWFDAMPLRGQDHVVEESDEWVILRNGAGAALKHWKHKSGTPEHVGFLMTSRDIWEREYRPHVVAWDPGRVNLKKLRSSLAGIGDAPLWKHYGHLFVWELARQSMGDTTLFESLLLDSGWMHDYCRVYTDLYKQAFALMFQEIGLPHGVWIYEDLGYRNGLFASPKVLEDIIFPYYREFVAFCHGYDLPVVLHTCGSTTQALPLIVEAGFDALNPMERKASGNDPFLFAERYGDQLAFIGGLDARVLESNDRAVIGTEVKAYIEGMKARGARLVFASDHSISPNTRYDSYRYALDVYRSCMWYE